MTMIPLTWRCALVWLGAALAWTAGPAHAQQAAEPAQAADSTDLADLDVPLDTGSEEIVIITDQAPNTAEPPSYDLAAEDIRVLPGSGNDTLKALQSLPGVARVPFGLGGLVLRGSSPRDSNVYLDGVEVPILYHFGGLASFYPSAMLDSVELVPGSFGVRYGRAQGGIVALSSRPGRRDRWRVASEASLIDASVRAEGPGPAGGSWTLGLRRSYVDAVLGLALPQGSDFSLTLAPRYYDGQLRYDVTLPSGAGVSQRLAVMIFGSDDRLAFAMAPDPSEAMQDDDRLRYVSRFARAAVHWQRAQGNVTSNVTPWLGVDGSSLRFNDQGITRESIPMGARADITRTFATGYVSGGVDVQGGRFGFDINNQPPPMPGVDRDSDDDTIQRQGALWYTDMGLWVEALHRVAGGNMAVKPGVRVDRYGLTGEWVIDPRVTMNQELGARLTLEQSFGMYHQPPVFADVDPVFGNRDLGSSYSVQATVGARVAVPLGAVDVEGSITGFHDQMYDLPVDVVTSATGAASTGSPLSGGTAAVSRELTSDQFGSYSYQENVGRGRNYGVELLVHGEGGTAGKAGSWMGWLSYTLSRSLRRDDPTRYLAYRPYVLDQPHVLTALGTVQPSGAWRLGARVRYASGNPITPVESVYFDTDIQSYRSIPGELLSERLPAFFQLDVRLDRRWRRHWGTISLFLDVQNLTNRVNPEGVSYNFDYSERKYTRGLPIFPSLGVEYQP